MRARVVGCAKKSLQGENYSVFSIIYTSTKFHITLEEILELGTPHVQSGDPCM